MSRSQPRTSVRPSATLELAERQDPSRLAELQGIGGGGLLRQRAFLALLCDDDRTAGEDTTRGRRSPSLRQMIYQQANVRRRLAESIRARATSRSDVNPNAPATGAGEEATAAALPFPGGANRRLLNESRRRHEAADGHR